MNITLPSRQLIGVLLLGIASGLPLLMVLSNYTLWLAEVGVSYTQIGLLSCISLPYTLKFCWAPFLDLYQVPWLSERFGHRRAWLCLIQPLLALSLVIMGHINPAQHLLLSALAALFVSFFSASQDIVIDALRVEQLSTQQQGPGAAMAVNGYRVGTLVAGALGLYIAQWWGWASAYSVIALCLILGQAGAFLLNETPKHTDIPAAPSRFFQRIAAPLLTFFKLEQWWALVAFIILFKLGHSYIEIMSGPFYEAMAFTKGEIATITKLYGFLAMLAGSFAGGWCVMRFGIYNTLILSGMLQAISPFSYWALAQVGHSIGGLIWTITIDYFFSQMASIALVTYLGLMCDKRFTASHFALFTSLAALGRTIFGMLSGWFVELHGWESFFIFSFFLSLPGIFMILHLRKINTSLQPAIS